MSPQTGRPLLQFESRKNFFLKHRGPAPINPPMNADRHAAYVHAKSQLDDLSQSKLLPEERAVLYDAADDLLLTNDPSVARAVKAAVERTLDADDGRAADRGAGAYGRHARDRRASARGLITN